MYHRVLYRTGFTLHGHPKDQTALDHQRDASHFSSFGMTCLPWYFTKNVCAKHV